MPSLAVCCGEHVRGPPQDRTWNAKHSLALGPPFPPQEPYLLPRTLTSTPGCPQRPLHLHLRTLICIPAPLPGATATITSICTLTLSCAPQDTPRDPVTCPGPSPLPQLPTMHPHLHSRMPPGTLTCTSEHPQGALLPPHDLFLHPWIITCTSQHPQGPPITSPGPSPVPSIPPPETPAISPAPSSVHQDPPGICASSSSPPQCPHPLFRFPTFPPRNTHPPSWTLTPPPGPLLLPRAELPGCSCSLPAPRQDRAPWGAGRWVLINFQAL